MSQELLKKHKLQYLTPREFISKCKLPSKTVAKSIEPDEELIESIENIGVKLPIIVDRNFVIIDGCRRYLTVKKLINEGKDVPGQVPIVVIEDVDYLKNPEEALLRAFLINRYRRGASDKEYDIDLIADILWKLANETASRVERKELLEGKVSRSLRVRLAKLTGYSDRHIQNLLMHAYTRIEKLGLKPKTEDLEEYGAQTIQSSKARHEQPFEASVQTSASPNGKCACGISHTVPQSINVQSQKPECSLEHSTSQIVQHSASQELFRIELSEVVNIAKELDLLDRIARGEIPRRLCREIASRYNVHLSTVYRFVKDNIKDIKKLAKEEVLNELKLPLSKSRLFAELPIEFIDWLKEQSKGYEYFKFVLEKFKVEEIEELYNKWKIDEKEGAKYLLDKVSEYVRNERKLREKRKNITIEIPETLYRLAKKVGKIIDASPDTVLITLHTICEGLLFTILNVKHEDDKIVNDEEIEKVRERFKITQETASDVEELVTKLRGLGLVSSERVEGDKCSILKGILDMLEFMIKELKRSYCD